MISAGDFRNGITLEIEGNIYQILEFQHVKPGKGAAFVRTKLKNVINGGVVEKTFRPTEKFPAARIDRVDMQYLYSDGDLYNFMNVETLRSDRTEQRHNRRCTEICKRERDGEDLFRKRKRIRSRASSVCRAGDY